MPKRRDKMSGSKIFKAAAAEGGLSERYLVPALIRGLNILQELSGERRRLALSEVAAALGVTRSSAYRLLFTLGHMGFVVVDPATKTYTLGPQVLRLGYGYLASRDPVEVAMPHLVRLRDRTGWSAHLGELHGRDVVYLARVATRRSIASTVHVGTRLPARFTTMGRILLSGLSSGEVRELYRDEPFAGGGKKTVGTLSGLLEQLAADREADVVVQNSGYEPGIASIAAPIRDMTGQIIAAINISAVALLTNDAELNGPLKAEVLAAAEAISRDLGHQAADSDDKDLPPARLSAR
ncbi:IclR family transcriptional regulator [Afipia sp. GAS231]|uniref:IclR family transcriptional regulator n=1 Tax=Afipia sp. GAS231 TaxID=1882747 RepID=UPI00087CE43E|nr:IclR family transcriptional regulator [Afipia sp. GAS231]SDO55122.1 transcriptional regulator, IclR family [Afipia sp. GAS231]